MKETRKSGCNAENSENLCHVLDSDWRITAEKMDNGYKSRVMNLIFECVKDFEQAETGKGLWVYTDCVEDFVRVCNIFGLYPCGGAIDFVKEKQYFYK